MIMEKKENKALKLRPYGLDAENVADFGFLVAPDVIEDIKNGDGTTGFVVKNGLYFVGALCGRFVSPQKYRITSIFVSPDVRRRGVATFMMETLYSVLPEHGMDIIMDVQRTTKDGVALCSFLESIGFEEYYSENNALYSADFVSIERIKVSAAKDTDVRFFSMIPQSAFYNFAPAEGEYAPLPEGGFADEAIDRDLSVGILRDGRLIAYAIVETYDGNNILIHSLYVEEGESKTLLMTLVATLKNEAEKRFDMDTKLFIPTANERMAEFVEKIFPKKSLSQGSVLFRKEFNRDKETDYNKMSLSDFLEEEKVELKDHFLSGLSTDKML